MGREPDDEATDPLSELAARAWELTIPIVASFTGPTGVDDHAYAAAVKAAVAELGVEAIIWAWASVLWTTTTPGMSQSDVARYLDAPSGESWLRDGGRLLDAAAAFAADGLADAEDATLQAATEMLPENATQQEVWECVFYWARKLDAVTAAAGGFDQLSALSELHTRWLPAQCANLASPLALVVGTFAAGHATVASGYLGHLLFDRRIGLRLVIGTWIVGLAELVRTWDRVVVVGPDGMLESVGSIEEIPVKPEERVDLRQLAILTRSAVAAVRRGEHPPFASAPTEIDMTDETTAVAWCLLIARILAGRVAELSVPS